jgi:hypothetical protein
MGFGVDGIANQQVQRKHDSLSCQDVARLQVVIQNCKRCEIEKHRNELSTVSCIMGTLLATGRNHSGQGARQAAARSV